MADLLTMGIHVVNVILLIALFITYSLNYRTMKSKYTAGLLFFVGIFLVETVMALYFDTTMVMYYSGAAAVNASVLQVIKAAGLGILLWISLE